MRRFCSGSGRLLSAATALATVMAGLAVVGVPAASATTTYGFVNMGDSLSSGEGTYNYQSGNTSTNVCHRSDQSYSNQYVGMSADSWSLTNIACSGAGTFDIYSTSNPNTGGNADAGEPPQDSALSSSTRLVTVS